MYNKELLEELRSSITLIEHEGARFGDPDLGNNVRYWIAGNLLWLASTDENVSKEELDLISDYLWYDFPKDKVDLILQDVGISSKYLFSTGIPDVLKRLVRLDNQRRIRTPDDALSHLFTTIVEGLGVMLIEADGHADFLEITKGKNQIDEFEQYMHENLNVYKYGGTGVSAPGKR